MPTLNNVRGLIRSLDRLAIRVRLITIDERFPDKANLLIKRGAESDGSLLLKNNNKMAELPKDIIPSVEFGFLLRGKIYGKESKPKVTIIIRNRKRTAKQSP